MHLRSSVYLHCLPGTMMSVGCSLATCYIKSPLANIDLSAIEHDKEHEYTVDKSLIVIKTIASKKNSSHHLSRGLCDCYSNPLYLNIKRGMSNCV